MPVSSSGLDGARKIAVARGGQVVLGLAAVLEVGDGRLARPAEVEDRLAQFLDLGQVRRRQAGRPDDDGGDAAIDLGLADVARPASARCARAARAAASENASSGPPSTGSPSMRTTSVVLRGDGRLGADHQPDREQPPIDTAAGEDEKQTTIPTPRRTATGPPGDGSRPTAQGSRLTAHRPALENQARTGSARSATCEVRRAERACPAWPKLRSSEGGSRRTGPRLVSHGRLTAGTEGVYLGSGLQAPGS